MHMIRRFTGRNRDMKEKGTAQLIQDFVISRLKYVSPYIGLTKFHIETLNRLIRKALIKQALGLRMSTLTTKLLHVGLHNTIEDLIEGHPVSQRRLTRTHAGCFVL